MRNRLPSIALALVAGGAVLWLLMPPRPPNLESGRRSFVPNGPMTVQAKSISLEPKDPAAPADEALAVAPPDSSGPVAPAPKPRALAALAELPAGPEVGPGLTPFAVLENMRSAFRDFSARFGGNPVGTNPEITAALNGDNPAQTVFVNPDDGLRLNDRGELVDNWGTPFFFHQLSRTEMEIRSAGPDGRLWTRDDLVIR